MGGVLMMSVVCACALAACSSSGVNTNTPIASDPSSATATPAATVDPQAEEAVDAYTRFVRASTVAEMKPFGPNEAYAPEANFVQYSFDPARYQTTDYIADLDNQGIVFKGTPPTPNVRVKSVDMKAKPYPTVTLSDCETQGDTWRPTYHDNGKPVPTVLPSGSKAKPPFRAIAKVIFYKKHWGVQETSVDASETCSP